MAPWQLVALHVCTRVLGQIGDKLENGDKGQEHVWQLTKGMSPLQPTNMLWWDSNI